MILLIKIYVHYQEVHVVCTELLTLPTVYPNYQQFPHINTQCTPQIQMEGKNVQVIITTMILVGCYYKCCLG